MDFVKRLSPLKKAGLINKSAREKQKNINVNDVWYGWDLLIAKYDLIDTINIFLNFVKDEDLKLIIKSSLDFIEKGASELEQELITFAIPLPQRPKEGSFGVDNVEIITDRYICIQLFQQLKELCPICLNAFLNSASPIPITFFKTHLIEIMDLINNISIYAEVKGYLEDLPVYLPS